MHHKPLEAKENPELVSIIHCADVFANRLCSSAAGGMKFDKGLEFNPDVLYRLRLEDPALLEEYIAAYRLIIETDMRQFEGMFSGTRN
jgi:hypothetical protein